MAKFKDIPQFPTSHYEITVPWTSIERELEQLNQQINGKGGLELNPDYQRCHVWTKEQQIAYIEYQLQGGEVGRNIIFNSPDWDSSYERMTELIDGKQRLESVRSFLRGDIPAFSFLISEYEDKLRFSDCNFRFRICKLNSRAEVLRLYLNINAGGTPHTKEEIQRVKDLLNKEINSNEKS